MGLFAEAIDDLEYAINLNFDDMDCRKRLAFVYVYVGKQKITVEMFSQALPLLSKVFVFNQALGYLNDDAEIYFHRARCNFYLQVYTIHKKLDSMYEDLMKCVSIDPHHQHALALLSLYAQCPVLKEFNPFPIRERNREANLAQLKKLFDESAILESFDQISLHDSLPILPAKFGRAKVEPRYDCRKPHVRIALDVNQESRAEIN